MNEKRDRFTRVASNRVQRIIDTLGLLANCANRNNYEYTEADVKLMFNEIDKAVRQAREAYAKYTAKEDSKFTFDPQDR